MVGVRFDVHSCTVETARTPTIRASDNSVETVGGVRPTRRRESDTVPSLRTSTVLTLLAPGYSGVFDISRSDVMLSSADPA